MNNLRGYYERALQDFGTYDDGKVWSPLPKYAAAELHGGEFLSVRRSRLGLRDLTGTNPVYQAKEMKQNENVASFPV